ncbi:MAG: FdhF/YdeP family oxidoreductase [Kordiimonas sp.]
MKQVVGGGTKKVLYTLNTIRQMGVTRAAKALNSKNACKACALGMGGQNGGMTNELDEFPSVCNKSVQAQSSDVQAAIPEEVFTHTLNEFRELDGYDMEHMGRLNTPLYKAADANKYAPISWEEAFQKAAQKFRNTSAERSFFYSSGRSSNEAGFILQLIARAYGTNNVNNCSYYCHQATSVALSTTIGTGTATVELDDLHKCDLIFVIGANPSSNHPRFIHKLAACRARGGEVVMINPAKEPGLVKFAIPKSPKSLIKGGDEIASDYLMPKIGSDIALFKGIAKAILEIRAENTNFIAEHANGFDAFKTDIAALGWTEITELTGIHETDIRRVAKLYAKSKSTVFAWGMGMTHHQHGSNNVEYIANLALLRGMIGEPGKGLLPLRGHSNVQGIGTIGVKPVLPKDVFNKIEQAFEVSLPRKTGMDTVACLEAAHAGKIDSALIMGGNLYAASPKLRWAEEALGNISFKLYLTTTLNESHFYGHEDNEALILPVTARDEEWQPTTQESMFNFVRLSDGGINRLDNVKPESVILSELATRIMPDSQIPFGEFQNHSKVRDAIAKTVPGLAELADIDVAKKEFHIKGRILHEKKFNTPDGKVSFQTRALPVVDKAPFTLTTIRSEGQFNTIIYERSDSYRPAKDRWTVMMNADDMKSLGIESGGKANLKNANGMMKSVTVEAFDLARGSVMAYFPEANNLTATTVDARSKTPNFKSVPVEVEAL